MNKPATTSTALAAVLFVLAAGWARAEVTDSAANGFTVKFAVTIQAAPTDVYRQLFHVADWWDPQHTFSHDSHNLSMEEKAGGCFCEKLPNQGGVRHMEVVYFAPGKAVVMTGGLGPLQAIAASGSMSIRLTPADGATRLEVSYTVGGYLPAGLNTWAAPVDSVLQQQFTRLKNYAEHGDPAPKPPGPAL